MRAIFGIATLLSCLSVNVAASAEPGEKDAVALAERGALFIKTYGKAEMIARINRKDPLFNQGALYLAMRDMRGITIAHPTHALIGKDFLDVPDADGKAFRHEMLAVAKGSGKGWVDYKFRNPTTGKVAPKSTYVLRVDDVALEAGIYKH